VVFGPFFLSQAQIVAFIVAVAATLGVELLLRLTTWGKAVRAVADDLEAAEVVGVNSTAINIGAFALASGLAGIAGTVLVTYFPTSPGRLLADAIIVAPPVGEPGSVAEHSSAASSAGSSSGHRDDVELGAAGHAALRPCCCSSRSARPGSSA
jgi:hypothetical protein